MPPAHMGQRVTLGGEPVNVGSVCGAGPVLQRSAEGRGAARAASCSGRPGTSYGWPVTSVGETLQRVGQRGNIRAAF